MTSSRRRKQLGLCAGAGAIVVGAAALAATGLDRRGQDGETGQPNERQQQSATRQVDRSPEAITAHELVPLREVRRTFAITEGEREGEELVMTLQPAEDGDGYVLQFGEEYRLHLMKQETIYVTRLDLLNENKGVIYDPPVELIPSTVEAGRRLSSEGIATVYELNSGERTRDGRYHHEFQRVTKGRFHLPQGRTHGYLIDIVHQIELDNADMEIDLEVGTDDRGIIYWRYKSYLEKLGLFGSTTISQYEAVGPAERATKPERSPD